MAVLAALGLIGTVLGFIALSLCIASGLYFISELVEEYTTPTKRLLTQVIYLINLTFILLIALDRLPWWLCAISIGSHTVYLQNLRRFPHVRLRDPWFLLSCPLVALNHVGWYRYFGTRSAASAYHHASRGLLSTPMPMPPLPPSFAQVASFFALLVWLVPFALFISLSAAGDNVLPTMANSLSGRPRDSSAAAAAAAAAGGLGAAAAGDERYGRGRRANQGVGMARALVVGAWEAVREVGARVGAGGGVGKGGRMRRGF
ncbi:MAG: erv26 super protein [Phylliscum demangeonii]|nr:MAG: erv26 super protein [Phylliscum demangeonii]